MNLIEEAEQLVRQFWKMICDRESNAIDTLSTFFAPEVIGFGSEFHEKWLNKESAINQIAREFEIVPDPVQYKIKNLDSIQYKDVVVCMGDMNLKLLVGGKTVEVENLRFIMSFYHLGSKLLCFSLSGAVMGEGFSDDETPVPGIREPKHFDEVTILFADFQQFTNLASTIPTKKLVAELNDIFSSFDEIIKSNRIYKVKTIGDAYMAVGGLSESEDNHAVNCVNAAIGMIDHIKQRNAGSAFKYDLRVGIHSGPIIGGTVGTQGLSFDVFGDSVNIANRIEQASEPGRINLSAYTYDLVRSEFECEYRGKLDTKGKGPIDMYWIKK